MEPVSYKNMNSLLQKNIFCDRLDLAHEASASTLFRMKVRTSKKIRLIVLRFFTVILHTNKHQS